MKTNSLLPIGSELNIDKSQIKTDLPQTLINKLPQKIIGKIIDYKITDGSGIGYVLMTESNSKIWIFDNELNEETIKMFDISYNKPMYNNDTHINQYIEEFELNGNYKINYLLNPINLVKWLLYTLKDIV